MIRNRILLMLAIPAAICLTSCGLGTYGLNATTALVKNAQTIKFTAPIVDEAGNPMDDVNVEVIRNTQEADVYWPGEYTVANKENVSKVSGALHYEKLGGVCVKVTFRKPGYQTVTNYYANGDEFSPDGRLVSVQQHFKCINVSKNAAPPVVMVKEAAVTTR